MSCSESMVSSSDSIPAVSLFFQTRTIWKPQKSYFFLVFQPLRVGRPIRKKIFVWFFLFPIDKNTFFNLTILRSSYIMLSVGKVVVFFFSNIWPKICLFSNILRRICFCQNPISAIIRLKNKKWGVKAFVVGPLKNYFFAASLRHMDLFMQWFRTKGRKEKKGLHPNGGKMPVFFVINSKTFREGEGVKCTIYIPVNIYRKIIACDVCSRIRPYD